MAGCGNAAAEEKSMIICRLYIETGRKKGLGRVYAARYIIYVYTQYCDNDDRNIMIYCV